MSGRTSQATLMTAGAIRAWLECGREDPPLARADEALDWARKAWFRSDLSAAIVEAAVEPDRLYALVRVVYEDPEGAPPQVEAAYHAVNALDWPSTVFDEKLDLLSRLAYVASRQYRRAGEPRSSWTWEKRAVELTCRLPAVSEFLALDEQRRTSQLRDRFLTDPCVLLAMCANLYTLGNRNPAESLREAVSAHSYILNSKALKIQAEERIWFLVQLEIIAALGAKFRGDFAESDKWLDRAHARCQFVSGPEISRARIEFARRSVDHDRRAFESAQAGLPELTERFRSYGMERHVALSTFMDAITLKEMGHYAESLAQLHLVATYESAEVDEWIRGLSLIYAANIWSKKGEPQKGLEILSKAWALVGESKIPTAIAHFHGVKGEILRDIGRRDAAVESYRLAVQIYELARCGALEALLRIILAETLMACGRDAEALAEIVAALRIADTLGLLREGAVAVALLRESLGRQYADKEALLILKAALQGLNEGNR